MTGIQKLLTRGSFASHNWLLHSVCLSWAISVRVMMDYMAWKTPLGIKFSRNKSTTYHFLLMNKTLIVTRGSQEAHRGPHCSHKQQFEGIDPVLKFHWFHLELPKSPAPVNKRYTQTEFITGALMLQHRSCHNSRRLLQPKSK